MVYPGFTAAASDAVFAVDHSHRVVGWNEAAAGLFGFASRSARDEHSPFCYQLLAACDDSGRRFCRDGCQVMAAARDGRTAPPVRVRARARDGRYIPVEVETFALGGSAGVGVVLHRCIVAAEPAPVAPLTAREREILGCLCAGDSTAAMARTLGISATTVRNHIQHLLEKLGVHSRAEAVALAHHREI